TYVPHACRMIGRVVDTTGRPLNDVELTLERVLPPGILRASWDRRRRARSDADGVFDLEAMPDMLQAVTLSRGGRTLGTIQLRPRCGLGSLIFEAGSAGVRLQR
ncbi:MAG TPA: hypothetical protein VFT32_00220, partial [Candidatus Eisenbacteria bacterium]|nr:hypothetical protein [Candidatus Eisenbacteria bacterium]